MSLVPQDKLEQLNLKVKQRGHIDREHLMEFLTLIPTNEAKAIIKEVKDWLQALHDDPAYERVVFPTGDIDSVIGDLDSYGRLQPETLYEFKQNTTKSPPQVM